MMSSMRSKIGALLVKPALKATLKDFDSSEHGGSSAAGIKWTGCQNPWKFDFKRDMQFDHPMSYI